MTKKKCQRTRTQGNNFEFHQNILKIKSLKIHFKLKIENLKLYSLC